MINRVIYLEKKIATYRCVVKITVDRVLETDTDGDIKFQNAQDGFFKEVDFYSRELNYKECSKEVFDKLYIRNVKSLNKTATL